MPHPSAGFYATVNPTVFPVTRIKLLSILASEDGLKSVQSKFPDLEVITRRVLVVLLAPS